MSRFKKAVKKKELASALDKHPLKALDEAVKQDYVKGLVFIALEDENFSDDEKSYVKALIQNIGLEEAFMDEAVAFANDADEDAILEFMDRLKAFDADLKLNFMIEVVVISFKDGEFDESEQEMFNDYIEMLELEEQKDDIMYLAMALVNKDIDLALAFYTAKKDMFMKYDYMFDMIDVDIDKELNSVFNWEWTIWSMRYGSIANGAKVALKPETVQRYSIMLNSLIISGTVKQRAGTDIFVYRGDETVELFKQSEMLNLTTDGLLFTYQCDSSNSILLEGASILYQDWITDNINSKIQLLQVTADSAGDIEFDLSCPGKPEEEEYEFCKLPRSWRYYTYDNFGSNVNSYTKNATKDTSSIGVTFRLMKLKDSE